MFTGIITAIGRLEAITDKGDRRLRISCDWGCAAIEIGASLACSGICLNVIDRQDHWFEVAASAETIAVTTLGDWQQGDGVNLERALCLGDELGGHIVSGHVDGVVEIIDMKEEGDSTRFVFSAPQDLQKFIAPKGSVALNGTSLTVNEVSELNFGVNIIPHTKEVTTWGTSKIGDYLNLEIDTLARYVARLNETNATRGYSAG